MTARIDAARLAEILAKPGYSVANEDRPHAPALPRPEPQRHEAAPLGAAVPRATARLPRPLVRFVGFRVCPLDPDNFAAGCKDLLDGLRHAGLIPGDEAWRIRFLAEQERVAHFVEEKTVIEITIPTQ
jgi:hypothetical protein